MANSIDQPGRGTLLLRSFFLVVLGVAFFTGVAVVETSEQLQPYRHSTSIADVSNSQEAIQYDDLSQRGKSVFRDAVEAESSVYTSDPAPDFGYPPNEGPTFDLITYQDTTYRLSTEEVTGLSPTAKRGVQLVLAALGIGLLIGAFWPVTSANQSPDRGSSDLALHRVVQSDSVERLTTKWIPAIGFSMLVPLLSFLLVVFLLFEVIHLSLYPAAAFAVGTVLSVSATSTAVFCRVVPVDRPLFYNAALLSFGFLLVVLLLNAAWILWGLSSVGIATFVGLPLLAGGYELGWQLQRRL
jgi:hypothetical protein